MNSVLATSPFSAPHLLQNRHSPTRSVLSAPSNMASRKRKADDDLQDHDERMSASPSNSPSIHPRSLPLQHGNRNFKRTRTNVTGRPLDLPRLLETLSPDDMRGLLTSICDRHPEIGAEVVNTAPRPSVSSAIQVLSNYESALQASFPFGNRNSSDYAYNRVRQALSDLIEALKDYTPHFLPPNEDQAATSLSYLDSATEVIHRLPNWETYQHNRLKQDAYDDIAKAWALVVKEAAKRGGGIQLQYGGWDQKIAKHNELSGGKMQEAVNELQSHLGWMAGGSAGSQGAQSNDPASIRQQLLNGTYGAGMPVRVGPW